MQTCAFIGHSLHNDVTLGLPANLHATWRVTRCPMKVDTRHVEEFNLQSCLRSGNVTCAATRRAAHRTAGTVAAPLVSLGTPCCKCMGSWRPLPHHGKHSMSSGEAGARGAPCSFLFHRTFCTRPFAAPRRASFAPYAPHSRMPFCGLPRVPQFPLPLSRRALSISLLTGKVSLHYSLLSLWPPQWLSPLTGVV